MIVDTISLTKKNALYRSTEISRTQRKDTIDSTIVIAVFRRRVCVVAGGSPSLTYPSTISVQVLVACSSARSLRSPACFCSTVSRASYIARRWSFITYKGRCQSSRYGCPESGAHQSANHRLLFFSSRINGIKNTDACTLLCIPNCSHRSQNDKKRREKKALG